MEELRARRRRSSGSLPHGPGDARTCAGASTRSSTASSAALRERHGFESSAPERLPRAPPRASRGDSPRRSSASRDHASRTRRRARTSASCSRSSSACARSSSFLRAARRALPGLAKRRTTRRRQPLRERIEALEQLARDLREGNFESISPEAAARAAVGEARCARYRDPARPRVDPAARRLPARRRDGDELTPRAIRRIGAQALATVYGALRKGRPGGHDDDAARRRAAASRRDAPVRVRRSARPRRRRARC